MKGLSAATFAVLVIFVCGYAFGQDYTPDMQGRFGVGIRGYASEPESIDDEGLGGGILAEYYVRNWFSLLAEGYYIAWDGLAEVDGPLFFDIELDTYVVGLSAVFNFPQWSSYSFNYSVYAGVGVDWYFFDTVQLETGSTGDIENDFGGHAMLGVNWFVNDDIVVTLDARLVIFEPEFYYSLGGIPRKDEFDLGGPMITLGFKYFF